MAGPDDGAALRLRHVTLADASSADVTITAGRIAAVDPAGSTQAGADIDLTGYILLPGFVEPHAHLDKAFTADAVVNPDGSLLGAILVWRASRVDRTVDDIAARAWAVTRRYLAHGTVAIRAHIDVGDGIDLRAIEALLSVRHALGDDLHLQIVALCSTPGTGLAGANYRALLRDALAAGVDLVGGAPAIDEDPGGAVDVLAGAAADAGVGLDLHVDETIDASVFSLGRLIDVARAGFAGSIAASHVVSLGVQPLLRQREVAAVLAEVGISVVTLPQTNLYLQGRDLGSSAPRGLTAVRALLEAGVSVSAGGDNLQDPFNPMGRADPLETASLLVVAGHVLPPEALSAVTTAGRRLLGLPPVAIEVGCPADLVAIRAPSLGGAMAGGSPERIVFRGGRVVAETTLETRDALAGRAPR